MTDKEYRELAKEYLEPIKLISMKIKSLKEDLKHVQSDITTIGAVDYSKECLTGGGTPGGLEQQIIRLESKRDAVQKEIGALIDERETAADIINTCTKGKENILLMREYVDGKSAKHARYFTDLEKSQASELKTAGLIKVGYYLHHTYYPSMYTAKTVQVGIHRTISETYGKA